MRARTSAGGNRSSVASYSVAEFKRNLNCRALRVEGAKSVEMRNIQNKMIPKHTEQLRQSPSHLLGQDKRVELLVQRGQRLAHLIVLRVQILDGRHWEEANTVNQIKKLLKGIRGQRQQLKYSLGSFGTKGPPALDGVGKRDVCGRF